jgi:hypothetical protein
LQPLDNGIFNVIKGVYWKELQKLASLTDSAPVDKVNFIRAYAKAREAENEPPGEGYGQTPKSSDQTEVQ